ncbi:MAG TPA: hypothetical protein VN763_04885, partial [Saprospiraceae bacterium]|nr:hypothetical protein [Saprospiraceae bacterium]
MKKISVFSLWIWVGVVSAQGQDQPLKVLDQQDYLTWKTIKDVQMSADGMYSSYRVVPGEGDPVLNIYVSNKKETTSIPRVSKSQFDYTANIVVGTITPFRDSLRALERKKVDKKKWPCDTLFVYYLENDSIVKTPYVTGYAVPSKLGGILAYTLKKEAFVSDTVKDKKASKKEIVHLIVRELSSERQDTFKNI